MIISHLCRRQMAFILRDKERQFICEPSNSLRMTFAVKLVEQSPRKSFFKKKELLNVFIGIACRFFDKCYRSFLSPYSQLQTYSSSGIPYVALWSRMKLRLPPRRNMDWRRPAMFWTVRKLYNDQSSWRGSDCEDPEARHFYLRCTLFFTNGHWMYRALLKISFWLTHLTILTSTLIIFHLRLFKMSF